MSDYPDVDSFLEHHGVKGMKWGVHRDRGGSGSSSGKAKPSTQDILNARARSDSRVRQVNSQIDAYNLATTDRGRKEATDAISRIQDEGAADLKIAQKSTTGEKVAATLVYGTAGAVAVAILLHK